MKDELDINGCYRKVFELIGRACSAQELVRSITEITGVNVTVLNVAGELIAESEGAAESVKKDYISEENFLEMIFSCMEAGGNAGEMRVRIVEESDWIYMVSMFSMRGNDQGVCVLSMKREGAEADPDLLRQLGELVCRALALVIDNTAENGMGSGQRERAIRRIAAKILFEKGYDGHVQFRQVAQLYEKELKPGFVEAIVRSDRENTIYLNQIGNLAAEFYEPLFYYVEDQQLYLLFSGVNSAEKILEFLQNICEKHRVFCGVSDLLDDAENICKVKNLIGKALDIGMRWDPERKVYRLFDYYMQIVSACAVDEIGHVRYLEKELQQLKKEDALKGTEFYVTLREYLLLRNNVSATAKRLFIHRNTMIYRLRRISEFLEIDINDPAIAQNVLISIMLQEQETC